MWDFKGKEPRSLYRTELQNIVDNGEKVDVRGRETLELLNVITEVTEPWHHCILIPARHWNPWLAMSEALWILAGRDDVAALKPYNSHISDYSDDGIHLYGAYGTRIFDQIDPLIERLRKDPSDRRAVLQIWDQANGSDTYEEPWNDLTTDSKDPPCNNMVYFKLRKNMLHMTVINRSNDIHYGLYAVNLPTFGILQAYIAARLGVDMGTQTHFSNSLHVYTDDKVAQAITDRMLYGDESYPKYPEHGLVFNDDLKVSSHTEFAQLCSHVLDIASYDSPDYRIATSVPRFLIFAISFLWNYQNGNVKKPNFNWENWFLDWPEFADWVAAGMMFADKVWKSTPTH